MIINPTGRQACRECQGKGHVYRLAREQRCGACHGDGWTWPTPDAAEAAANQTCNDRRSRATQPQAVRDRR